MNHLPRTSRPPRNYNDTSRGKAFAEGLLHWNRVHNKREMPWKGEKNPYKIWLSEIILQQTRVDQGKKYYQKFISTFPDIISLANAKDEIVYKLWEGLGYYSRCKNLLATARFISWELGGVFPKDFHSLLRLKGVGHYTASAIASFAYDLPHAVLDGNVFRVLSRIFDIELPIDSLAGKKTFSQLAQTLLPKNAAAFYNQAIMDFGAVICKPVPECNSCFFKQSCLAYRVGKQDLLPIKEKRVKIKERWLNYFVVQFEDRILIRQRTAKDVWQHLFEFLLVETPASVDSRKLFPILKQQYGLTGFRLYQSATNTQRLTHQVIHFSFAKLELKSEAVVSGYHWVKISELSEYAFPKTLQEFVRENLK